MKGKYGIVTTLQKIFFNFDIDLAACVVTVCESTVLR